MGMPVCDQLFASHPGKAEDFWLPVDRRGALAWLDDFLRRRFAQFGPYEDAITPTSDFVFHSVRSPLMNLGLLTSNRLEPQRARMIAAAAQELQGRLTLPS